VGARNEHLVLCFANQKGNFYCEEVHFFSPFEDSRVFVCVVCPCEV
jgi:hypothetical protein